MRSIAVSIVLAAIALAPSARADDPPAAAQSPPEEAAPSGPDGASALRAARSTEEENAAPAVDHLQEMWRFELGYRGSYVPDAGYAPFSTNGFLPQVSLAASRTLFTRDRLSFAPGLGWDYGSSDATARGAEASLTIHRLTVPLEGRYHLGPWGYVFLRAAPGVALASATVDDASAPAPMKKSRLLFATDVSAGYAWLIVPRRRESEQVARVWLQADGGYGWVAKERLDLAPDRPASDPQQASGITLGSLSMSGGFFRVALAMSF